MFILSLRAIFNKRTKAGLDSIKRLQTQVFDTELAAEIISRIHTKAVDVLVTIKKQLEAVSKMERAERRRTEKPLLEKQIRVNKECSVFEDTLEKLAKDIATARARLSLAIEIVKDF